MSDIERQNLTFVSVEFPYVNRGSGTTMLIRAQKPKGGYVDLCFKLADDWDLRFIHSYAAEALQKQRDLVAGFLADIDKQLKGE